MHHCGLNCGFKSHVLSLYEEIKLPRGRSRHIWHQFALSSQAVAIKVSDKKFHIKWLPLTLLRYDFFYKSKIWRCINITLDNEDTFHCPEIVIHPTYLLYLLILHSVVGPQTSFWEICTLGSSRCTLIHKSFYISYRQWNCSPNLLINM